MASDRPSNVGQLLNSAALREATLIAGESGLDSGVADVVLRTKVEASSPPPSAAVVILDASGVGDHLYQVDVAIRVVADAGASALIVANAGRPLGVGAHRLANRFSIPLVVVEGVDAMSLTHRVRARVWAPDVEHASVVDTLLGSLSLMRLDNAESVVEVLSDLSSAKVSVVRQDMSLVAGHSVEVGDRRIATRADYLVDHTQVAALHSSPIVLAPGEPPSFWLLAESSGSDSSQRLLRSLMQISSWYLAALLTSVRVRAETNARQRIALFNEILDPSELSRTDLHQQMHSLNWTVSGWNAGLHIKLVGVSPLEVIEMHDEMVEAFADHGLAGTLVERRDGWAGWLSATAEPQAQSYAGTVAQVEQALGAVIQAHAGLVARAGIGRPQRELAGVRSSLSEAHEASVIASSRAKGAVSVAHIDQIGVQRVLMGWFSSDDFARYARTVLEPVLAVDPDFELLRTLEAFLDASSSTTEAAQELQIHRNTVANRIRRVAELLDVSLEDPETRLSLQLSCRVLRLNR